VAGQDGTVHGLTISTIGMKPGLWAITYHGKGSNHESIGYFYLTTAPPATVTPTRPPQGTGTTTRVATSTRPPNPQGTPNPSATIPIVPTETPSGLVLSVRPGSGPPNGQFIFSARGLAPNEAVQVQFTDPNNNIVYPQGSNGGQYTASATGTVEFTLQPDQAFPSAPLGVWLYEVRGQQSDLEGVVGFTLR
jgi:hypothetical protein